MAAASGEQHSYRHPPPYPQPRNRAHSSRRRIRQEPATPRRKQAAGRHGQNRHPHNVCSSAAAPRFRQGLRLCHRAPRESRRSSQTPVRIGTFHNARFRAGSRRHPEPHANRRPNQAHGQNPTTHNARFRAGSRRHPEPHADRRPNQAHGQNPTAHNARFRAGSRRHPEPHANLRPNQAHGRNPTTHNARSGAAVPSHSAGVLSLPPRATRKPPANQVKLLHF